MTHTKTFYRLAITIFIIFLNFVPVFSQNVIESDPKTYKYFKILANTDDDSVFIEVQKEMSIDPMMMSYILVINVYDSNPENHYIVFGEETDATSLRAAWFTISSKTQKKLLNWSAPNKTNLQSIKLSAVSPFTTGTSFIKLSDFYSPAKLNREVNGKLNYINPYFHLFGGERLGVPLKGSLGASFGIGTKYSGPFESDQISVGLNIIGLSLNYVTRLEGLNTQTLNSKGEGSPFWNQFNNTFSPPNAWEINLALPFGNFFELGFYRPFGENKIGGPARYTFYQNGDSSKAMPNNIVEGNYFNFEFRYPFRFFNATRSQLYAAYYLKEVNLGFFTRESRLVGSVFDLRINYNISNIRNNQLLFELMISDIFSGFGSTSLALGPSFRFTKLESGNFGLHTFFINARFKLGDYYDSK
ncbi:MAG: hypothetical protein ACOYN6_07790 [Ignavibacteria bacterium]